MRGSGVSCKEPLVSPSPVEVLIRPQVRPLLPRDTRARLARLLRASLRALQRSRSQVSLLLTDDHEIRTLNRHYRKLDRATDVLSFHQVALHGESDPAGDGIFLGDIVISAETALRRSSPARLAPELARLAVHGLCHLFGHDHHRAGEARAMRALEAKLLRVTQL